MLAMDGFARTRDALFAMAGSRYEDVLSPCSPLANTLLLPVRARMRLASAKMAVLAVFITAPPHLPVSFEIQLVTTFAVAAGRE